MVCAWSVSINESNRTLACPAGGEIGEKLTETRRLVVDLTQPADALQFPLALERAKRLEKSPRLVASESGAGWTGKLTRSKHDLKPALTVYESLINSPVFA
jgi:hypothetical protein